MRLLIIGGTRFVGLHLVAAAQERGVEVTLFNRGQQIAATPGVETVHGDRATDLNKLARRRWDAVIDTCGFLPRTVSTSAKFLADSVERYVFISSQSVYADVSSPGVDETTLVKTLTPEQLEQANAVDPSGPNSALTYGNLYGGLKALAEQAVEEAMPGRVLTLRPGLIVGPDDYTDRFTYWVIRVSEGGEVLAPGRPQRFVQFIDSRDVANWTLDMIQEKVTGVFNVNGPPKTITMESLLKECRSASQSEAEFTWVSEEFLKREAVAAWSELPVWLPETDAPQLQGYMFVSTEKATTAGLTLRPLSETVKDTLEWVSLNRPNGELKAGLGRDRELALLEKWRAGLNR